MSYRSTNILKVIIFFYSIFEIQSEDIQKPYKNLTKALQNSSNVRVLDLSFQNLTTFPKEIGQFKNLQRLDLSGNELTVLSKEIVQLQNLQELSLHSNKLTNLPKEIEQLKSLKKSGFISQSTYDCS